MAIRRLQNELRQIIAEPSNYYSIEPDEEDFFTWHLLIFGPEDTIYEGGIFKAKLVFNKEYPIKPPIFNFVTLFPHPNIFKDGKVCISILHEGNDEFGYEHISERWRPTHNINTIVMSIISILTNPNLESSANLDASLLWKNDWDGYKKIIYKIVAKSH